MNVKIKYEDIEDLEFVLTKFDYLQMYSNSYGYICGYEKTRLCYVIPFVIKKKWIFTYMQVQCETIVVYNSATSEKNFLNLAIQEIKKSKKIDFISQPKTNVVFNSYPDQSIHSPFGSYIIDLTCSKDQLWKNIHVKHKNVIRRAIKNGVTVEFGSCQFDNAYKVIHKTLSKNKIPMMCKNKLLEFVSKAPSNVLIGCSYLNKVPQGAVIVIFDNIKGFYFWGGTSDDLSLGANNLLHWEVIKFLKSKNVKYYDFVGARVNTNIQRLLGIQRFKRRFGATLKHGYLWKYPIVKWKYLVYTILYKARMGKGDVIDQENNNNL
jgi:lipid II:glycine glycyltransferase (peptidoglycan interpeptide bridge formation enzyme)